MSESQVSDQPVDVNRLASCGSYRMPFSRSFVGAMTVDRVEAESGLHYTGTLLDGISLIRVRSGRIATFPGNRRPVRASAGAVVALQTSNNSPITGCGGKADLDILEIDPRLLNDERTGAGIQLTGVAPTSAAAGRHMASVIDFVVEHVRNEPFVGRNPTISREIGRYVVICLLAAFPHTQRSGQPCDAPDVLRRAINFIEDHADTDISVSDIAAAVYVTPRALQYAFRNHRDCTPTDYVRGVRLQRAHIDLTAGNRNTTTVGHIARHWGFVHSGRFAVTYRNHYGRCPRDTLDGST